MPRRLHSPLITSVLQTTLPGVVLRAALAVLLAGCRAKPQPPPTVADLHFPVVVLFENAPATIFQNAADLGTMRIGYLHALKGPPPLIDSSFHIYTLSGLASTHGGLWLLANPTGVTPVTFQLEPSPKSGLAAARELMRSRLEAQTWRRDLDQKRAALATQQTLAGLIATVNAAAE